MAVSAKWDNSDTLDKHIKRPPRRMGQSTVTMDPNVLMDGDPQSNDASCVSVSRAACFEQYKAE